MSEQDSKTPRTTDSIEEALTGDTVNNVSPTESSTTFASTDASSLRGTKIISFRNLCRCGDEVWIENDGTIYRLRRTKLGKLILTK